MARKLKSDKLLFTATLLLVGTGIVMNLQRLGSDGDAAIPEPAPVPGETGGVGADRPRRAAIVMRVDYRNYRQPAVIWTALGVAGLALVAVLFAPRVNGATRWIGLGPLGIQPSELAKIAVILSMAALLESGAWIGLTRSATRPCRSGSFSAGRRPQVLAEPDLRTAACIVMIAAMMVFAAGISYRYLIASCSRVPAVFPDRDLRLPDAPRHGVPRSLGRSARRRLAR